MEFTPNERRVLDRVKSVWAEAQAKYQIEDAEINNFNINVLENKAIRKAVGKVNAAHICLNRNTKDVTLNLNSLAIEQNVEDFLSETVPHELAHLVCFLRPHIGGYKSAHDEGWATVCKSLGGRGDVRFGAEYNLRQYNITRYIYHKDGIGRFAVSANLHGKIQAGESTYKDRLTKEKITKADWTGDVEWIGVANG